MLDGTLRHELACSACGAPLHDLKRLPSADAGRNAGAPAPRPEPVKRSGRGGKKKKKAKARKRSLFQSALREAFDVLEDIFD
ncbi:hypothetical protein [Poseidonocella sedimentorum]|uniref:Uncharacterized protein n=1 Tax=Poseidonocella sedimentorum TaxID=871652 RepID=A0A1I6CU17_9RHOB|nr:hypothetical protein [Poseidonocella sedimentorum]SFQ96583.1 hypothetical protein SAMN04515673_101357 [Poseidonocella sedimentorum]